MATLRGRIKQEHVKRVLVGDRVLVRAHADGGSTIEKILARKSVLRRRMPGNRSGARAVAANVDRVIVMGSVVQPDWDLLPIDRFVVVSEVNRLPATIVINKCDLSDVYEDDARPYTQAGYRVVSTSVPERRNLKTLRQMLEGHVSLFIGLTGVGKSSLLNALQPGLQLRTGEVSRKSGSGRHTTVSAEMHRLGNSGYVVDTPGLRGVGLWGVEPMEVQLAFPELAFWWGIADLTTAVIWRSGPAPWSRLSRMGGSRQAV